jgi:putative phosphoesterase
MRVLIISDLQANLEALQALITVEPRPDAVLCLGDFVGLGPDPAAVVDWFVGSIAYCVAGDDDVALVTGSPSRDAPDMAPLVDETLVHTRRVLHPLHVDFLSGLPRQRQVDIGDVTFALAHGDELDGLGDPATLQESKLIEALGGVTADIYLVGHTHRPSIRWLEGIGAWLVNPGSLGQPRYGSPDATFAVWQDGQLRIQHLHYHYEPTVQKLRLLPLDPDTVDALAKALSTGA